MTIRHAHLRLVHATDGAADQVAPTPPRGDAFSRDIDELQVTAAQLHRAADTLRQTQDLLTRLAWDLARPANPPLRAHP